MRKFIPLIILLLVVIGLVAFYGPGFYRAYLFRSTMKELLNYMREGDTKAWGVAIDPSQQRRVLPQLGRLPGDYEQHIASIKLTSYETTDPDTIWAIVTCRLTDDAGGGIYQGKMRWRWQNKRWTWDFTGSYAAQYSLSGEPNWVRLEDMLTFAEAH